MFVREQGTRGLPACQIRVGEVSDSGLTSRLTRLSRPRPDSFKAPLFINEAPVPLPTVTARRIRSSIVYTRNLPCTRLSCDVYQSGGVTVSTLLQDVGVSREQPT